MKAVLAISHRKISHRKKYVFTVFGQKKMEANNTSKTRKHKKNRHEIIQAEVSKNYGRSDQNRPKCR